MSSRRDGANRGESHVAIAVLDSSFQLLHRPRAADRRQGLDRGHANRGLGVLQQVAQGGDHRRQLQAARQPHRLKQHRFIAARQRLVHFLWVGQRQALGGGVEQVPHPLVGQARQPRQNRLQGFRAELPKQLAQLICRREHDRLVQRLEELGQSVGLGEPRRELLHGLSLFRHQLPGPLAQHVRHRTKVADRQEVGDEVFHDRNELGAHCAVGLQLQQVE